MVEGKKCVMEGSLAKAYIPENSKEEFVPFSELKPTWEMVGFDECIDGIPCVSKESWMINPLDKNVALLFEAFEPNIRRHVFFLPKTGQVCVTEKYLHKDDLSEIFKTRVSGCRAIREKTTCSFIYEMVMGEYLVYRQFEIIYECSKVRENDYSFTISPITEVCRYVFHSAGVFVESRDHVRTITSAGKIDHKNTYDTLRDANGKVELSLYQSFKNCVKVPYKDEIIRTLSLVKTDSPKLGIASFIEIYSKAVEKQNLPDNIPKRILRELNGRNHEPGKAVRIEKNLIVLTGERKCNILDCHEQTRVYFDRTRAYYFRRNAVTNKWTIDDLVGQITKNRDIRYRIIDKDIFDNTCMEKYAKHAIARCYPKGNKVNLGFMLAQAFFLSAEQAAKTESPVIDVLLENIYEGKINDREKSLPKLLGITGSQLKFINNIEIPRDLGRFAECMEAEDFKKHFRDVKKRIFAVAFYLNGLSSWNSASNPTKEEVFAASRTLNALEKRDDDNRDLLLSEYRDYIRMRRTYQAQMTNMDENTPLRQEILAFGEVPVNIKPSKIRDYHHKLGRIVGLLGCSDQITAYTAAIEKRYDEEAKKTEYTNGEYSILMPKNAGAIVREGRILHHCVGSAGYIGAMAADKCTILFLRDNHDLDTPLITIEVRNGSIRQCFGFRDSYNKDPQIRDFVKEYASLHDLKIEAVIYTEK